MKISSKKNTSSVEFTVEFDKNDLEPARIKALSRLARDVKIPGFRNGKAPANIVEQHVDPNQLASETLDIAVRTAIPKLFDGTDMMPISIPHVEIAKYVPGEMAEITVKENAYVNPGETIGSVAAPTKYYSAEGSNVYFALTHNGDPVNGEALFH